MTDHSPAGAFRPSAINRSPSIEAESSPQGSVGPRSQRESFEPDAPRGQGGYHQTYNYGDYYYGYGGSEAHDTLMAYIRTVYRRRWTAVSALAAVLAVVIAHTFTATPIYESRVQILIQPENPNVISFEEVLKQEKGTNEFYQTQYTILKSRALARRTIDTLKLWDSPEFGGGNAAQGWTLNPVKLAGAALGWVTGFFRQPAPTAVDVPAIGETEAQSGVVDAFLAKLTVSPIRNSRLVDVRFATASPVLSAQVANAIAREYIEQNLETKFLSTKDATDFLSQQLAEQRRKLEDSEQALQKYREQGNAVALEDRQNIVVQRLADLSTAYTQARTARIEKEALYTQLTAAQNNPGALDSFPAVLANTFIQSLKTQLSELQRQQAQMSERLGENHPEMQKLGSAIANTQARIQGEIGKIVESVRSEFNAAQAQERSLAAELERQKAEALALNRTGIEYGVLRREAESNKQIYDALMQRAKETGISGELKVSNVRVVDEAQVPRAPVRPRKSVNLLLGLLGGFGFALGLVYVQELLDSRIKDPDEIPTRLGMRFLGLVPGLKADQFSADPLLDTGTPANFAESFRTLRTNLVFSSEETGARAVVVTSTRPAEGKTIVAANLAISLAQTGQRVILIDSDMRRPRQHEVFKTKRTAGLAGFLAGTVKLSEAVQASGRTGLWVLPAGFSPHNPAELLGSDRFTQLLKGLRENFDWTIIDSPPVMAVSDAAIIAHMTTGVVFVVGCEQTSRHVALRATRQLLDARATFLGAVLNRVDLERNPYYYSHYYRAEYSNYYTSGTPKSRT